MTNYRIIQTSPLIWMIVFIVTNLVGIGLMIVTIAVDIFNIKNPIFFLLVLAPFVFLSFFLANRLSQGVFEIQMDEKGISRKIVKAIAFNNSQKFDVVWNDVANYFLRPGRQFDHFRLNLKHGDGMKFYHIGYFDKKDDFREFLSDLKKYSQIDSQ